MDPEENIPLTKEDVVWIKKILSNSRFEDFRIHKHYWLAGVVGIPRHGFEIKDLKKLFSKSKLITRGFKRKSQTGFSYTLIYKISKNYHVRISYFFDEFPMKIFNVIPIRRNLEKAISRRYGLSL